MTDPIKSFLINNPKSKLDETDSDSIHSTILTPWDDDSIKLSIKHSDEMDWLLNIHLPPDLVAIDHKDSNVIEFVFGFLTTEYATKNLHNFTFVYQGKSLKCEYSHSSKILNELARCTREISEYSQSNYRNLRAFRDNQQLATLPDYAKNYFSDKEGYSFKISGDISVIRSDYSIFAKHFNFYHNYFNRSCPEMIIVDPKVTDKKHKRPCLTDENKFINSINAKTLDPIILDILSTANQTKDVRLKFIFYFQVLEFCSYYHLKESLKTRLSSILSMPDINFNKDQYTRKIIEELKDASNVKDDKAKLESIICELIRVEELALELNANFEYFKERQIFEGGFIIEPLFTNSQKSASECGANTLKDIKDNIVEIRNAMVHLRESRENKIVLPTKKNNNKIFPYLYLLRRIAEIVAIRYNA
ncbi:hypothetical protein LBMAG53_21940 [Planctomycetota bacterium]|nr:hypothetical protein LBMAG53_21940 [Planctomycetota bacterium]